MAQDGQARRLALLALMVAVAVLGAWALGDRLSFAALADNRARLIAAREAAPVLTAVGFVAAYAGLVALSLPGALVATLTGGFLFGVFPGLLFNVIGATIGAVAVFIAARWGAGDRLAARIAEGGGRAARVLAAIRENELSVLFLIRLVPVVPFFLANLLPAFAGVATGRFALTTFFGILPGALVYTSVGAGLSEVIARGETPDLGVIFTAPVLVPLLGLAALAALPIFIRRIRGREL